MPRTPLAASIAVGSLFSLLVSGCGDPGGSKDEGAVESVANDLARGEIAIARSNRLDCHAASDAVASRVLTLAAPAVTGKGSVALRLTPAYL